MLSDQMNNPFHTQIPETNSFHTRILSTNHLHFNIYYVENLNTCEALQKIETIPNAQVLLWYIGCHGLKEEGVKFYKDKINTIINGKNNASCWLVDFTAWGSFTNLHTQITSMSKCAAQINKLNIAKIKCLSASKLFEEMKNIKHPELIEYFKTKVVIRKSLFNASENFKETMIKIGTIFNNNCCIFEQIYENDANKSYSLIQYIEGCFLINEIVRNNLNTQNEINIVFFLPNDEAKYYYDKENNFIKDVEMLIKTNWSEQLNNRIINIFFINFKYGDELYHRPYNSGKKIVKNITKEMLY